MEIKNFSKDNKSKNVAISDSESNEVKKKPYHAEYDTPTIQEDLSEKLKI